MKHVFVRILLAISVLVLSSCQLQGDNSADQGILPDLVGSWQWMESSGGFTGGTLTPSSTGYNQELVFNADRSFLLYRFNIVLDEGTYSVRQNDGSNVLHYSSSEYEDIIDQDITFVGADSLLLVEKCADCYRHIYTRSTRSPFTR